MSEGEGDDTQPDRESVGFRKPPKGTQFKPGQSGNAKGRPKGAKNFAMAIDDQLNVAVVATEAGKRRRVLKRDVAAIQLVNKAAAGDVKAMGMLLQEERARQGAPAIPTNLDSLERPEDRLVIASIVQRIRQMDDPGTDEMVRPEQDERQIKLPDAKVKAGEGDS